MIRKIHCCWFGGPVPANVAANVAAWQRLNPNFEIREWSEANTDLDATAFGRRALAEKKWGFVADIVRLQKLQTEGGFYLDTDVELVRPLALAGEEAGHLVLGYIYDCALGTAVIYSPPRHPVIGGLLEEYQHVRAGAWPVNNTVFTDYFINRVPGFRLDGRRWQSASEKITVYPKEFFEQPALIRQHGMAIHHCSGSWMAQNAGGGFQTGSRDPHLVKWLKRQLRTFVACLQSEYRGVYRAARRGRRLAKISAWREG